MTATALRRRGPRGRSGLALAIGALVGAAVAVVVGLILTCIVTLAIWPGEAKLLAPLLCDDGHPQAFVVTDSSTVNGETSTNFTLYCVGERGDFVDRGWARPFLLLTAFHAGLVFIAMVVLVVRTGRRAVEPTGSAREQH